MSESDGSHPIPVYVRARDAAFYANPVLVLPEGFICFDEEDPPELVLWLDEKGEYPSAVVVLHSRLGKENGVELLRAVHRNKRAVPGVEPPVFKPAQSFYLTLSRRIPQPTLHDGSVLRTTRAGHCFEIDLPAHPLDAHQLTIVDR